MKFRSVRHVYLATMMAVAAFNALSERIALAQIPEAPGTFVDALWAACSLFLATSARATKPPSATTATTAIVQPCQRFIVVRR